MSPQNELITMKDIRKILRARTGMRVSRSTVYGYIKRHRFPKSTGLGRPRVWHRTKVESWIAKFIQP